MTKITRRKVLFTGLAAGVAIATAGGASALPLGESSNAKVQFTGGQTPGVRYKVTFTVTEWAAHANTNACTGPRRGPVITRPERTRVTHTYGPIRGIFKEGKNHVLIGKERDGVTENRNTLVNLNDIADCVTKEPTIVNVIVTPD